MTQPKILVGCPASEYHAYATDEYLETAQQLTYSNYDLFLVDNSSTDTFSKYLQSKKVAFHRGFTDLKDVKQKIMQSRNYLRDKILKEGYDYFLCLEQDVIPPKDVIEQLLKHKKPIVSGVYYSYFPVGNTKSLFPVLYRWLTKAEQENMKQKKDVLKKVNPALYEDLVKNNFDFSDVRVKLKPQEVEQPQLMKVKQCGLGCILIAREVLEKISFRVDEAKNTYDDAMFCDDALAAGYDLYADTSVKCKHLLQKRPWTWKQLDKNV